MCFEHVPELLPASLHRAPSIPYAAQREGKGLTFISVGVEAEGLDGAACICCAADAMTSSTDGARLPWPDE